MATEATARAFFTAPYFAVVGASSDPTKFGHKSTSLLLLLSLPHPFPLLFSRIYDLFTCTKANSKPVFTWYTHHNIPATPINPTATEIKAYPPYPSLEIQSYPTLPNLSALPHPTETSVSIITPPKVTKKVLEEAKKLGIQGVWLQPGAFDDEALQYALKEFKAGVGGEGGAGSEGWCVLVDGESAARAAGKDLKL
jgi:predicted CoA-binding protein